MGLHALSQVRSYKYLGHIINDNLSDNEDIMAKRCILYARANMLIRQFHYSSDAVKHKLFNAYCKNLYLAPLWASFTKAGIRSINVAYNNCFRILLNLSMRCSASQMFVEAGVDGFNTLMRRCIFSFRHRILNSNNTAVRAVVNCDIFLHSVLRAGWNNRLYL